jgi:hypothetical protein
VRHRPRRRRSVFPPLAVVALASAAVALTGCIGQEAAVEPTPSPIASSAAPASPSDSAAPSPTTAPTAAPPSATAEPTVEPSASASPTPSGSDDPSASEATAEVCTGTDDNRSFFADAAARFTWPVYCGVLPARWNVISGSFGGAGGGSLDISYRGPNGAVLSLRQGASCSRGDGCPTPGTSMGDAPFGDQTGVIVELDDGGWAIAVDRGANPSWVAVGTGMDEPTFRGLAAELARLD